MGVLPDPEKGFVTLVFQEDPAVHDDYVIQVKVQEDGTFTYSDWAPEWHDLNVRFYLMAKQATSGGERRAQTTFTDALNKATFADTPGGSAVSSFAPSLAANACRDAFVQARNGGNLEVVPSNQTVTLSSSPSGATFYAGAGCGGAAVTTLTVQSGQSSAAFSFKIATAAPYKIHGDAQWSNTANDADASVTVTGGNSAPTNIALSSNTVAENQASGTIVGTLSTTDPNAGDTHTYTLVAGAGSTDNASFTILGNSLNTAAGFDFETKNTYSIRVRTTDPGGLFFDKAFSIVATDVNEAPSAVSDSDAAANSVAENAANGTTVGLTGFASDVDGAVVYSLTNNAGGRFAIDSATGVVTVANETLLDFESATSHSITIQASDGEFSTSAGFTIAVTNVNEAPSITSAAAASVAENTTAVQTVTALDPDAGTTLTFSIVGGADQAKFSINGSTGALTFTVAPDFETPTDAGADNCYEVELRASDGALHDTKTVLVTVTDVNEAPSITSAAAASVAENTTTVQTVTAFDPDAGATLAFSIVGGADQAKFSINSSTGALTFTAAPDFETPTDAGADNVYEVQVRASDGALYDAKTVLVTVSNVNEAPTLGVLTNQSVMLGNPVSFTATASDPDAGTTLVFSLSGAPLGAAINLSTGQFTWTPTLAQVGTHTLDVVVSDGVLSDSAPITITVSYLFVGFAAPIANAPAFNVVNAGRVIPVKWQLQDTLGTYILDLATVSSIAYRQVPCASETLDNVITGTADTAGSSGLRITGNDYIFTWQTDKGFTGKCFDLRVALNDGSSHIAKFKFTK